MKGTILTEAVPGSDHSGIPAPYARRARRWEHSCSISSDFKQALWSCQGLRKVRKFVFQNQGHVMLSVAKHL
jgi:hypothetical protein